VPAAASSLIALFLAVFPLTASAAEVGAVPTSVELRNHEDKPVVIPAKKVIAVFYTDPDAGDMNDPLFDSLQQKRFDKSFFDAVIVINLHDSKVPNFIIRSGVKGEYEKNQTTILLDANLTLAKAWGLGDCNNTSVVAVIGSDSKVKLLHKGPMRGTAVDATHTPIESLIATAKASVPEKTEAPRQ